MGAQAASVALLRGVNVGGRNRIAMADLREILESLGHRGVRTYIQSGNAVFSMVGQAAEDEADVALAIRAAIADRLGLDVDVMVRGRDDLVAALTGVPYPDADPKRLLLVFLSEAPSGETARGFESIAAGPEAVRVVGRLAYLDLPNGVGRSVLAPRLERRLGVRATARNLATVRTLLAMCDEPVPR